MRATSPAFSYAPLARTFRRASLWFSISPTRTKALSTMALRSSSCVMSEVAMERPASSS